MIKLTPLLLALLYGLAHYRFSVRRTARMLDQRSTELSDPILNVLTSQMARAMEIDQIRVHIFEEDMVNGLAHEDGRIFITRGFMNKYRAGQVTADELASVIAHELGHVAMGHTRRRMIDFSGQNALRVLLAGLLGRFLPGIGDWIANGLMSLLAARISGKDEYEADAYAAALLVKSGIGTGPQKSLFAKLAGITGRRGAATPPAWLMSHPKTEDRIAAIEVLEDRWNIPRMPIAP